MTKSKYLFKIFFCFFICFSCKNEKGDFIDSASVFAKSDTLRAIILPNVLESRSVITPIYYSSHGLICCTDINNKVVQLIDSISGKATNTKGRIGRGPEEMLSPVGMSYNLKSNKFFVWDYYRNIMVKFLISDSIMQIEQDSIGHDLLKIKSITDSTYVALSVFPNQSIGIINNKGEYLDKLLHKVINDDDLDYERHLFSSSITLSYDKKYVAAADGHFPWIALYTINNNKLILKWKKMVFKSNYYIRNKWLKIDEGQILGFENVKMTDKYIYVCTQGEKYRNRSNRTEVIRQKHTYLLTFNLDGELINSSVLDKFFRVFDVTPDDKYLYAVTDDPDLYVIKYTLK